MIPYYPSNDSFDLTGYADADYAGYLVDRKSTLEMTHFLGSNLISYGSKKPSILLLPHAMLNFYESSNNLRILELSQTPFLYSMTISVLST